MQVIEKLDFILSLITASAIVFAAIQIKINRKQLFLSTITKCVSDFRELGQLSKDTKDTHILNKYVDLTNEELFYFQHKYIPKDVSKEWIDGMIDFMPLTTIDGKVLNADYAIEYLVKNRTTVFQNFPRILNAFEVPDSYDINLIYSTDISQRLERVKERKRLISRVLKNAQKFKWFD